MSVTVEISDQVLVRHLQGETVLLDLRSVAAGNVPFRARCLERSLTLWWLLRRRRIPVELRIGVRKSERDLEAHAWVELDGRTVNDRDDVHRRYAAFDGAERGALSLETGVKSSRRREREIFRQIKAPNHRHTVVFRGFGNAELAGRIRSRRGLSFTPGS